MAHADGLNPVAVAVEVGIEVINHPMSGILILESWSTVRIVSYLGGMSCYAC